MIITNKSLVKIGSVVNTFGKQGIVKLLVSSNYLYNEEARHEQKLLFYRDEMKILQPLKINSIKKVEPNLLLISFEGITDITSAEKLRGKFIKTIIEDKIFTEKPNYKDFRVLWEDQNWPVLEVMENSNNFLVKIKVTGNRVWIPLVDEYLVKIDSENKRIYVKNFERLF